MTKVTNGKRDNDNITIKITKTMAHIHNRYKLALLLPNKFTQQKLVEICQMDDEGFKTDNKMYEQILEYYLCKIIDEIIDNDESINTWEIKELPYKTTAYYAKYVKIFEVKSPNPVHFLFYFYTEEPIKVNEIINRISSKIIEDFGVDYLSSLLNLQKIKMLPNEGSTKTLKIPVKTILNEMEKTSPPTSGNSG